MIRVFNIGIRRKMQRQCVVHTCKNTGIHLFPQEESLRSQWVRALRLDVVRKPGWQLKKTAYICSDHFKPEDFVATTLAGGNKARKKLKSKSVPSIFPWTIQQKQIPRTNYVPPVKGNVTITRNVNVETLNGSNNMQDKSTRSKKFGACRCCLKEDVHDVANVQNLLECLNVQVPKDPRLPELVCSDCGKFLQQARRFRDMVAASQRKLLETLPRCDDNKDDLKMLTMKVEYDPDNVKQEPKQESDVSKNSLFTSSVLTIDLTSEVKQENMKDEFESILDAAPMADHGEVLPDDGRMDDDRGFSDFSDDDDDFKIPEENNETVTNKAIKIMERMVDAHLNLQIRENLSTILENSTIMPFSVATKNDHFECIYCEASYTYFIELKNHVESSHDEGFEYKTQSLKMLTLKRDPEMILYADISHIRCKLCCELFASINSLVQHLIHIHDKKYHSMSSDPPHNILCFDMSLDNLRCIECGKVFTHLKGLLMHMNQHYGSFLCADCGSKFLHERSYKMHMMQKVKEGQPPNVCKVCNATYSRKQHLRRHMKVKHPNTQM